MRDVQHPRTNVDTVPRCMKSEDLIMSGILTIMCCEWKVCEAYNGGYRYVTGEERPVAELYRGEYRPFHPEGKERP